MMLPAAEGAAQVNAAGIARVRKKPNAAVAAASGTVLQVWMVPQDRVQSELILTNKRVSAVVLVPIPRKGGNLLERYDNKPRVSVMMSRLFTTSSYLLDAKASSRRTRSFYGLALIFQPVLNADGAIRISSHQRPLPSPSLQTTTYLEKEKQTPNPTSSFFFQVVTSFIKPSEVASILLSDIVFTGGNRGNRDK